MDNNSFKLGREDERLLKSKLLCITSYEICFHCKIHVYRSQILWHTVPDVVSYPDFGTWRDLQSKMGPDPTVGGTAMRPHMNTWVHHRIFYLQPRKESRKYQWTKCHSLQTSSKDFYGYQNVFGILFAHHQQGVSRSSA